MEVLRTFLESSTVHGLGYISSTRRLVRLFWITVVIAGFTGAGIIIYQSFDNWAESPVTTTIETLPITEITLPKVTVCPPKNTFTNLNYDLMMLENMTLDNDTRNELVNYAVGLIQDNVYKQLLSNLSFLEEKHRFYNWYNGYTKIYLPYWGTRHCTGETDKECADYRLRYKVSTFATNGTVSTHLFGQKFDVDNIEKDFKYEVKIYPPRRYENNTNITLYINVEKNTVLEFDKFWSDNESHVLSLNRTITPPGLHKGYALTRRMSEDDISELQMDLMPGFRLTWNYNQELKPTKHESELSSYFLRLTYKSQPHYTILNFNLDLLI